MAIFGAKAGGAPGRSNLNRAARLLGACIGLLASAAGASADEQKLDSATLKAVKQSTVYLRVTFGDRQIAQGSGFFAGDANMVLTNAHVVGMLKSNSQFPQRIEVVVNSGQADEHSYLAEVVGVDPDVDLALLRVVGDQLPPPLKLSSGRDLEETQAVFIFGFPFGRDLGKQITVSKSSVSSLRKNEAGVLERIQVNGGVHRGNSGGPVVDAKGRVVGVAVAFVRNTQIDFAVPGNSVQDFLEGRAAVVRVGKPRQQGTHLVAVVRVHIVDPLNRIRSVSLDYWLGAKGLPRASSSTPPKAVKGDAPRQSLSLRLVDGVAEGEWTIPLPGPGQMIWAQPRFETKTGEKRWGIAAIVRPAPPEEDAGSDSNGGKRVVDEAKREAAARKDLKAMEGNWKLVRREVAGNLEDVDHLKLAIVIEDGKITWTKDEKDTGLKASIELNPTATPPAIDIEFSGPKQLGEQRLGIYELKGDKLVICWNRPDDKRPKKFTTRLSIGCGTVHETYKRIPD